MPRYQWEAIFGLRVARRSFILYRVQYGFAENENIRFEIITLLAVLYLEILNQGILQNTVLVHSTSQRNI
jgi:hypothetical protein